MFAWFTRVIQLCSKTAAMGMIRGLEAPANLQGKSLTGVLNDQDLDLGDVAISQYRYTEWVNPYGETVYRDLCDMKNDPGENVNIGPLPENQALMDTMARTLRDNSTGLKRLR